MIREAPECRLPRVLLEAQLAVRGLAPPRPVLPVAFVLQLKGSRGAKLVHVAAGKTRAVGAVPVLFKQHGPTTSGTAPWRSSLHRPHLLFSLQQKRQLPATLVWPCCRRRGYLTRSGRKPNPPRHRRDSPQKPVP